MDAPQREAPIYDLYGVVNHNGQLDNGHCFAFTRNLRAGKGLEWFYYDDDDVKEVKNHDLVITRHSYILFYSKMTTEDFWR